ncbi:MAG: RodZ domain-containing protein [Pseudomonadota bacterium]
MDLRGFDSYEISLGDEMRGERASLGKSLEDAERDLRIKARMITAIEDCDLSGFPNQSVIAGYVRSYARYLGMDTEDCYQRFCQESGYQSPAAMMSTSGDGSGFGTLSRPAINSGVGAEIAQSRFAAPPMQTRFSARISLGALTSSLALVALIAGLSYGAYSLLQDLQRIGIAPAIDAPAVVADAPEIARPDADQRSFARPVPSDYEGGGVLAALRPQAELPQIAVLRRDGPISAIDPTEAGMFARQDLLTLPSDQADEGIVGAEAADVAETLTVDTDPMSQPDIIRGIVLHATDTAWVRVRDGSSATVFEAIMEPGQRYTLPARVEAPVMRTGCPGNTFVFVDGVLYGPLGDGCNPKNVSLVAEDVRSTIPEANPADVERARLSESQERAEAALAE